MLTDLIGFRHSNKTWSQESGRESWSKLYFGRAVNSSTLYRSDVEEGGRSHWCLSSLCAPSRTGSGVLVFFAGVPEVAVLYRSLVYACNFLLTYSLTIPVLLEPQQDRNVAAPTKATITHSASLQSWRILSCHTLCHEHAYQLQDRLI